MAMARRAGFLIRRCGGLGCASKRPSSMSVLAAPRMTDQASFSRAFFRCCTHLGPQRRLLLRRPFAEALAALEAELTLGHEPFQIGRRARAGCRCRAARSCGWRASGRCRPGRRSPAGPSTASRRPNAALMTVSTVSASQMPRSTSEIASRHSACCRRLPMKPGTSFFTCAGILPASACSFMVKSIACRRGPLRADDLDQRHQERRIPPVRAERALAVAAGPA